MIGPLLFQQRTLPELAVEVHGVEIAQSSPLP